MEFKKWMLVLVLILGLTSCSSDDAQEDNSPEVVYADVKPTQTKYKAFYGQKLTKNLTSGTARSAETSPNDEMIKPVSVIFYPRTQTISFSNIFDNKTVEYKVTTITNNTGVSVIYNFKINETTFTCTITEKTTSTPANVVITFTGGFYKFEITDAAKKNIAKLVSKVIYTTKYVPELNYTITYTYSDTLLTQLVRNSFDQSLQPVVTITDYTYDGDKLVGRTSRRKDGTIVGNYGFEYENNLITKMNTIVDGKVTKSNTYEYDKQGRVITAYIRNSNGSISTIISYTFEKNKMTTIYTDPAGSYRDVEVSTYDSDRKPFLISQDQILEPFIYLNFTQSIVTGNEGIPIPYPDNIFEYSTDGLLVKTTEMDAGDPLSVRIREYIEE
jgi:hypothetical protein